MAVRADPSKGQKLEQWPGTGEVGHEESRQGGRVTGSLCSVSLGASPGQRGFLNRRRIGAWSVCGIQPDLRRVWCSPGRQRDRCGATARGGLRALSRCGLRTSSTAAYCRLPERLCLWGAWVLLQASLETPPRGR